MMPDPQPPRPETPEVDEVPGVCKSYNSPIVLSEGVELMMKRMESNPEEFDAIMGKWSDFMSALENRVHHVNRSLSFLSDYECNTLWDKYCEVRKKRFHHDVMERILDKEANSARFFPNPTVYAANKIATGGIQPGGFYQPRTTRLSEVLKQKLEELKSSTMEPLLK